MLDDFDGSTGRMLLRDAVVDDRDTLLEVAVFEGESLSSSLAGEGAILRGAGTLLLCRFY